MPIVVRCERCGKRYQVGDQLAGKSIACQGCGAAVPVRAPVAAGDPLDLGGALDGSSPLDELLGPAPTGPDPFAPRPGVGPAPVASGPQRPLGPIAPAAIRAPAPAPIAPGFPAPTSITPSYQASPSAGPMSVAPSGVAPSYGAPSLGGPSTPLDPGAGALGPVFVPSPGLAAASAGAKPQKVPDYVWIAIAGAVAVVLLVIGFSIFGGRSGPRVADVDPATGRPIAGTGSGGAAPSADAGPRGPAPRSARPVRRGPARSAKYAPPANPADVAADPAQAVEDWRSGGRPKADSERSNLASAGTSSPGATSPATTPETPPAGTGSSNSAGTTNSSGTTNAAPGTTPGSANPPTTPTPPTPTGPEKPTVDEWKLEPEEPTPWKFRDDWKFAANLDASGYVPIMAHQHRPLVLYSTLSARPEELWDLAKMQRVALIKKAVGLLAPGVVAPSGKRIAVALALQPESKLLVAEAIASGRPVAQFPNPNGAVPVCFAGDDWLLAQAPAGDLLVIDVRKSSLAAQLPGQFPESPRQYVVTPGGRYVICCDGEKLIAVEPAAAKTVGSIRCRDFVGGVDGLALSWSGRELLVWYGRTRAAVFDVTDGKTLSETELQIAAETTPRGSKGRIVPGADKKDDKTKEPGGSGGGFREPSANFFARYEDYARRVQWLPDGAGWLLDGKKIVERTTGRLAWQYGGWQTRSNIVHAVLPNNQLFGEDTFGALGAFALPTQEIERGIAAAKNRGAYVAANEPVATGPFADWPARNQRPGAKPGAGQTAGVGDAPANDEPKRPSVSPTVREIATVTIPRGAPYDLDLTDGWRVPVDPGTPFPIAAQPIRVAAASVEVRDVAFSRPEVGLMALGCGEPVESHDRFMPGFGAARPREDSPATGRRWVERVDLKAGKSLGRVNLPDGARLLALSPDGKRFAIARDFDHGELQVYEAGTVDPVLTLLPFPPPKTKEQSIFESETTRGGGYQDARAVTSVSSIRWAGFVDSDHLFLLGGGDDWGGRSAAPRLVLWKLSEQKPLFESLGHPDRYPTFTPGGKYLLCPRDDYVDVLDPLAGQCRGRLKLRMPKAASSPWLDANRRESTFAIHESGTRLAVASGRALNIFSLATGALLADIELVEETPGVQWVDRTNLLLGSRLYDVQRTAFTWSYRFGEARRLPGDAPDARLWLLESTGSQGSLLTARSLPGDSVYAQIEKGITIDNPRLFGAGDRARVETRFDAGGSTAGVYESIVARIERAGATLTTDPASHKFRATIKVLDQEQAKVQTIDGKWGTVDESKPVTEHTKHRLQWELALLDPVDNLLWKRSGETRVPDVTEIRGMTKEEFFEIPWRSAASAIAGISLPREMFGQPTHVGPDGAETPGVGESMVTEE